MNRFGPSDPIPAPQAALSPRVLVRDRAFVGVPLSTLKPGDRARLHASGMRCESCDLLNAMGLVEDCEIRVCKVGEPCIVQVHETRLGIPARLAREILVRPAHSEPGS